MDGDPDQAYELVFNDFIPLSFRVTFTIQLGLLLWLLLNLILFNFTRINLLNLLNFPSLLTTTLNWMRHRIVSTTIPAEHNENQRLIKGIWKLLKAVSIVNIVCWISYRIIDGNEALKSCTIVCLWHPWCHIYKLLYNLPNRRDSSGFHTMKRSYRVT
ncbi:hypothetical protein Cantr_05761 [Candida viswanathii]|uniref:Uncharacterized protein n=1 Tax=Candida viswanathii TaxID=5486 RepID=A0A367XS87_9ASCO|nr:hypothetical protein Cantr_05761 [Candida viswanathii]